MKDLKGLGRNVAVVVLGVFAAGALMNAFRNNGLVKNAINGFDG